MMRVQCCQRGACGAVPLHAIEDAERTLLRGVAKACEEGVDALEEVGGVLAEFA